MSRVNPWDEKLVEALKALHASGFSATKSAHALADEFGVVLTKNAVIGKWARLGLTRPKTARLRPPPAISTPVVTRPVAPVVRRVAPVVTDPKSTGVALVDLGAQQCRFGVTDHGCRSHLFCGAVTEQSQSFCPWHRKLAYQPKTKPKAPVENRVRVSRFQMMSMGEMGP
jgi:GcrA cell cycle regulator